MRQPETIDIQTCTCTEKNRRTLRSDALGEKKNKNIIHPKEIAINSILFVWALVYFFLMNRQAIWIDI